MEYEEQDEAASAVYLEFTAAPAPNLAPPCLIAMADLVVEPVFISLGAVPELTPRANSPPLARFLPARAPPV